MITPEEFKLGQVLLFDKPFDWSSFDVVKKVRYRLKRYIGSEIKIGHAGTLDPYATGLLVLCTGKMTKQIEQIQAQEKTYTGTIMLGATTVSYDLESYPDTFFPTNHITEHLIHETCQKFIGEIDQFPPIFSAKRVNGKRAYELARKGETPVMNSNRITIYDFNITSINELELHFEVKCSKGTYIRSLAHDFGKALDSGAYLSSLRRTKIGDYDVKDAYDLNSFIEKYTIE